MGVGIQLGLLLWKNFTYRRRQKFQLIVEILWPLFLFFILVSVRSENKPLEYHECHFLNKALPSAGTISWMQGLICHADNRCFRYPTAGETPGIVENFNTSIFSRFLVDVRNTIHLVNNTKIQDVLSKVAAGLHSLINRTTPTSAMKVKAYLKKNETFSQFIRTNTSLPPELVDELLGSHLELQVFSRAGLPLKQIACSQSILYQSLVARDAGLAKSLQKALCSLPEPTLQSLEHSFISELDWAKLFSERLTSRTAHVMNAVESLWSLLRHTELLAKEVSSMASFAEFLEALRVLSSRASGSNPLLAFKSLSDIICGHSVLELRNTIFSDAYEGNNFKSFLGRSDNKSTFCKGLIQNFERSPLSRILFVGKILYTPPTQATQKVMAEVNRTFQNLAKVHDIKEAWDDLGPLIYAFMKKSPEMRAIKNLLSTPGVVRVLEEQLHWNISILQNFLSANPDDQGYTWQKAYTQVGEALGIMSQFIKCMSLDKIEAIASEEELVRRALKLLKQKKFWAGIVFLLPDGQSRSQADLPPHVQFKIRMDVDDVTRTDKIEDRFWNPGPNANPAKQMMYIRGGFVYIQDLVEKAVVQVHRGTSTHQPRTGIYLQQMPYPCFVDDRNLQAVNDSLPLFLTLAWIYSVAMIIKAVVHEKETRLKETMKIMGLTTTTLWLSWFLSSFIPFSISTALQVLILKKGDILHHSDMLVVFLFLTTFAVATISQCFLISTFFSRANRAAACGGLIYFSCYMPYSLSSAWRDHITFPIQLLVSLLSPVAFCFGCEYFSFYEEQGMGVQWGNAFSSPVKGDYYSFGTSGIMLLFDAFLYGMATVYIEAVFPGQYGIPKPWNFPFKKSYWFGKSTDASPHPIATDTFHSPEAILEEPPAHLNVGVSIRKLVKIYHGSNKIAVNGLSLDFYEGQITSILGHNGAGKTTTMSVLTGLIPPTSGTAYIMGRDIRFEMDTIRKTLGMCPQHNVLFDILTVEEHIWFYGRLKGLSEMQVKGEMEQMIQDTGLPYKRQTPTKKLSGGMQRKLSVAIAFVGGSKVVFLDEPTAGVDPYSRRGIWELLLKYKAGRTIILSTHYMDEADLLGDRVAIISQGRLYCCGSSLFLKSKLGTGYYLTLVKGEPNSIDVSQLTRLVQTFIPGARLVEDIGQEVVYILPYSGAKDGSFGTLFRALDSHLNELGISGYGISDTSLEEIFLKVAEDTSIESPEAEEAKEMDRLRGGGLQASRQLTGLDMIFQQLHGLLMKRFLYTIRSRRGFFTQIVLPALFIFIALLFTLVTPPFGNYPPLRLEPWIYGPQLTFFSDESPPGDRSSDQLLNALLHDPGFGTKCMKKEGDLKDPCPFPSYHETGFMVPEVPASTVEVFEKGNWTMANPSPECKCSTGASRKMFPDCPEGAGGLPPPQMKTKTGDTLYNLTGRNISDYLVKTYPKIIREGLGTKDQVSEQRYGGFSLGARTSEALSTSEEVEAMVQGIRARLVIPAGSAFDKLLTNLPSFVDGLDTHQNMKVWFNNKGWHAMVSYVNVANNGLLRANLPSGADRSHYGITVINHPLNLTEAQQSRVALMDAAISLLVSICVIVAMSFIPASFVLFLIEERVNKSKHLQIISGMKPVLYWISNFAWDMCNYLISAGLVVIIFLCFQQKAYVSLDNFPALLLLLLLYGWSVTPMMYPASFFFNIPSSAYITLTCVNLFIGINTSVTTFILDFSEDPHLSNTNKLLKKYFLIFPHFCLGRGLMDMVTNQGMADAFGKFGFYEFVPPLSWDLVGKNLLAMTIDGVIFFIFTVLMDYHFFIRLPPFPTTLAPLGEEDEDVAKERNRITSGAFRGDILILENLTKVYWMSKKPAVDRLCLGIPKGECFGLLGVNGAGKTSTFQMLTGDSQVTSGDAFLEGYSIITSIQNVHKNMGYCPQFDALYDLLTAREHLVFYCRLHRIPEDEIPGVVKLGLATLGLMQYADRPAGEYSGGNKRKLSTAIALIGAPLVIFLDEPTTGMDPRAKRFLWNCILRLIKDGRSVVLTSHSMEECEALCTRMAIMVNGRFRCLGTVQHLKNKFGGGYTISLRISGTDPDTGPVEKFMQNSFPGIILKEKHHSSLQYQLPSHISSLANVFDILSANWSNYQIRDYSISQTTLDQVFVHFAKDQSG